MPPTFVTRTSRDWKNLNIKEYSDSIVAVLGVNKSESWPDAQLDDLVDMYDRTMTLLLDKFELSHAKTYRIRLSNIWFDYECLTAKILSRLRERHYESSNLGANRITWINQLRNYHPLFDFKQSLSWKLQVEDCSMNPKKIWRSINTVLGRTSKQVQSKHSDF